MDKSCLANVLMAAFGSPGEVLRVILGVQVVDDILDISATTEELVTLSSPNPGYQLCFFAKLLIVVLVSCTFR